MKQYIWLHQSNAISIRILLYLRLQMVILKCDTVAFALHFDNKTWSAELFQLERRPALMGRTQSYNRPVCCVRRCVVLFCSSRVSFACNLNHGKHSGRPRVMALRSGAAIRSRGDLMNWRKRFSYSTKQLCTTDTVWITYFNLQINADRYTGIPDLTTLKVIF